MKRVALFGYPVAHSASPNMHNAAFAALQLPWRYTAIPVSAAELPARIAQLRGHDWAGANVTLPHKVAAAALVDELADPAGPIGAINTIVNADGKLVGHNTDAAGFTADLAECGVQVTGRPAVILGAGGGARAVAHALDAMGARLRVVCRDQRAGRDLAMTMRTPPEDRCVFSWTDDGFRVATEGAALVVNTTPIGMYPDLDRTPWPSQLPIPHGAFVYDLVFNPPESRLVVAARQAGLSAQGGLGMLVEQAALAFTLWTGETAPRGAMRSAANSALEKQDAQISHGR